MNMQKFKNKKVLVCGASGMTGRNLFEYLSDLGADVLGTCFSRQDYDQLSMSMITDRIEKFYKIDFTDLEQTDWIFRKNGPFNYVFICCAKTYNARTCIENPDSMIIPNIQMAFNILKKSLEFNTGKVVYMSSATVYQPSENVLEEHNLNLNFNPHELYMGVAWAKRYIEKLCEYFARKDLDVSIVRPTNIYGEYDKVDDKYCHVVPALIMRAVNCENPFKIYGDGKCVKNFIYVKDLIRDMCRVASLDTPQVFNLCSDNYYSINDVVKYIFEIIGTQLDIEHVKTEVPSINQIKISRNKLDKVLGRENYINIKEGLENTISWYSSLRQTQKSQIMV